MGEGELDQFDSHGFERAFEWCDYQDRVLCWCDRKDDEYLFAFPGNAAFHITSEKLISCFLPRGSSMQMLRHLLLNQVIPRHLATNGRLVLHASAVTLENGRSVAFLGNSGFGKSTLVSSFHRNGARLINDDCILLKCVDDGVAALGGLVGIRLFPDSINAVFSEATGFTNYTAYTDKQQLFLKEQAGDIPPGPCVLDAMFLLNDPKKESVDAVSIQPVSGSQALMAMIYASFSLDPSDKKMIIHNFQNAGQTISDRLSIYSLQYPRIHEHLEDVRAAVITKLTKSQ